jgi:hypothetical protein
VAKEREEEDAAGGMEGGDVYEGVGDWTDSGIPLLLDDFVSSAGIEVVAGREVVAGTPTKPSLGGICGVNDVVDGGVTVWVTVTVCGVGHVQDDEADEDAVRPAAVSLDR